MNTKSIIQGNLFSQLTEPANQEIETQSPINHEHLSKQNFKVFNYLMKGNSLNTFEADAIFRIRNLHSRISDLQNTHKIPIQRKLINYRSVTCSVYWISPKDCDWLKEKFL